MAKNPNWKKEDIIKLKKNYKNSTKEELLKLFPDRTYEAINVKASRIGIHRINYFEDFEKQFILENYSKMRSGEIGKKLNRSPDVIENKAREMGLSKQEDWQEEEIIKLKNSIKKYSVDYISKNILKRRTPSSIYHKIQEMNIQKKTLRYGSISDDELIKLLRDKFLEIGRTPLSRELKSLSLPSSIVFSKRFGNYGNACLLAGIPINYGFVNYKKEYSKDGILCLSSSELKITNFLFDNKIKYEKEVPYRDILMNDSVGKIKCDWLLFDGSVVEFFGMPKNKRYIKTMEKKKIICKKYKIKLIDIYEKDLNSLKKIFSNYI